MGIGSIIGGRYELVRLIGEGGMGAVYEARHVQIGKRVALKFLHKEFADDREVQERFHREAVIAGNLGHTNIVPVIDYGISSDGLPFLVMEYLEGQSLAYLLKKEKYLSVPRTISIMEQVLSALSEAHRAGIVHRDLKPENVFLAQIRGRGEEVKILDFGISKVIKESKSLKLTKTGMMLGTPYYMSPEQIKGVFIDQRTDLYSCGIILFEALTGQVPYVGKTHNEIVIKVATDPVPDPRIFRPDLPRGLCKIVVKSIDKDPEMRFQTAEEFIDAMTGFFGEEKGAEKDSSQKKRVEKAAVAISESAIRSEIEPKITLAGKRRRRWVIASAASAFSILVLAFGYFVFFHGRGRTEGAVGEVARKYLRGTTYAASKGALQRLALILNDKNASSLATTEAASGAREPAGERVTIEAMPPVKAASEPREKGAAKPGEKEQKEGKKKKKKEEEFKWKFP